MQHTIFILCIFRPQWLYEKNKYRQNHEIAARIPLIDADASAMIIYITSDESLRAEGTKRNFSNGNHAATCNGLAYRIKHKFDPSVLNRVTVLDTAFYEENRIEIVGEYDVIVVGGGIAGVSAALAARRNHCSVLLLEKSVMLGGLATLGLIAIYLPLCDGRAARSLAAFAEELLSCPFSMDTTTCLILETT